MMKRRVIYMPDEDWARLLAAAKERGTTVSAIIRDEVATPRMVVERFNTQPFTPVPKPR